MIFVLSPAKKMNENQLKDSDLSHLTPPVFLEQSQELLTELTLYSPQAIASLMKISDALAWKNKQRFHDIVEHNAKIYPAVELFAGDVYRGLAYSNLDPKAKKYVQKHLVILSGLYGVVKANDAISPYRLEMGTSLKIKVYDNLYEFWNIQIKEYVEKLLRIDEHSVLINLASQEYIKVLRLAQFSFPVVTPIFKKWDQKERKYRVVGILAKYARGLMVRYAAQNQLTDIEQLKAFDLENYVYRSDLSDDTNWVFVQLE